MKRGHFRIFSHVAAALALSTSFGCTSRKHKTEQPVDSAKVLTNFSIPSAHRETLKADLESMLFKALRFAITESTTAASVADARLFDAVALSIAQQTAQRLTDEKDTACEDAADSKGFSSFTNCVLQETIRESFSSNDTILDAIRSVVKEENASLLGDINAVRFVVGSTHADSISYLVKILSNEATLNNAIEAIAQRTESIRDAVLLLRDGRATNDVPWISSKFFEGRRFVLTNSIEQASVGVWMRTMNLNSQIVRIEVSSNLLYIIREKSGLYEGSSGVDLIINSFPIIDSRTVNGERYFQVNFAQPINKHFVLSQMSEDSAAADLTVDSIKVRVAHTEKTPLKEFATPESPASGLYFNSTDNNLVLDELVLVNTNLTLSDDTELPPSLFQRETMRPTIRISQGLFALDKSSEDFDKYQARGVSDVMGELFSGSVADATEGKEKAYFTGDLFTPPGSGFAHMLRNARKYNTEKPITFVLSGNTPSAAVPVLKSTLETFSSFFEKLTPAGKTPAKISALTLQEFEAQNRTSGFYIGGDITAADPRVNMIYWEDNPNMPAAWATTVANPKTGEVISADVMMSGVSWGLNGCYSYMMRNWASKPRPGDRTTPIPVAAHHLMMQEGCRMVMLGMRLIGSPDVTSKPLDAEPGQGLPVDPSSLFAAVQAGDTLALDAMFVSALRKSLPPAKVALVDRRTNESDTDYSNRLMALYEQATNTLTSKVAVKVSGSSVPAMLKSIQETSRHDDEHAIADTHVSVSAGKNKLRANLDCLMVPSSATKVFMANSGVPNFTSKFITKPQDAIYATLRGVLLHELGHTFGLRHNFVASTTQGELESHEKLPVPVAVGSDSLMDYTDDGILLDMSAKQDYSSPTTSDSEPAFGMYDIFALSTLYGLDNSAYKAKTKTPFCTDGNKNILSNCVPFDFGKNALEHTIYQTNLAFQEIKLARDMDLAYGVVAQQIMGRYEGLLGRFSSNMNVLWSTWGAFAQVAANSTKPATQNAALKMVDRIFYANGLQEDFLKDDFFKAKMGRAPMGIWDFMHVKTADLIADPEKPQAISALFAGFLRNSAVSSFVKSAPGIHAAGAQLNPDNQFVRGIRNINLPDPQKSVPYAFRTMLINDFASKILIPEGTTLNSWEYFDSTGRKNGNQALDANGNAVTLAIPQPLFNHKTQFSTLPGVQVNSENGMKSVVAIYSGANDLQEMIMAGIALAQVAPWGGSAGGSEAFERVTHDRSALVKQITASAISPAALEPAKFMVGYLDTLLATGFSTLQ
jgi:hypothetical protein